MHSKLSPPCTAGLFLCAAAVAAFTGCVATDSGGGYVSAGYSSNVDPVFGYQDDYVYYPDYQMYYGRRTHRYYYQDGSRWISREQPDRVAVNVIQSAPSVSLEFHDSPARHHTEIVRKYPKHWRPPGADRGQKNGHRDDNDRNDRR